jgi:hypothetical protein
LFDTIVDLAKDRTQVIPFNLASEALNNSFFLNGLVSRQFKSSKKKKKKEHKVHHLLAFI